MLVCPLFIMISLIVGFTTIGAFNSRHYCKDGTTLAHEHSCVKYLYCQNKRYVERECPFGIWNEVANRCEFSNVCRVRTDKSWHSLKVPDCSTRKNPFNQFQHPFDCSKFYECKRNALEERLCPNGLFWNQENSSCEAETTCEAASRQDLNKLNIEVDSLPSRRHNGCDQVHVHDPDHHNDAAERKPSIRQYAGYFDDIDSSESSE